MPWLPRAFWPLLLLAWIGCTPIEPIGKRGLSVELDADSDARSSLGDIEVLVESAVPGDDGWRIEDSRRFEAGDDWPLHFSLAAANASVTYRATATARDKGDAIIAQARAVDEPGGPSIRELHLRFDVECLNRSSRCDRAETCMLGECVDAREPLRERTGLSVATMQPSDGNNAPECAALTPGALFCSADGTMLECIDTELARIKLCGENQHCSDA
ncbi:MAG TPA: hypothetical protein VMF89_22530, partial [Polyangiales bacterium]|nr:hypothetical protein [Polyangiales bacterium]